MTPLSRFHEQVFAKKARKAYFSGSYRTWVQPEVFIRHRKTAGATVGASFIGEEGEKVELNALMEKYIVSRRDEYFQRGWQYFKRELYEDAYNEFELADRVSFKDPKKRAKAKLAQIYTAIASQQHNLAVTQLIWLLREDRRTGQLPDPYFLLSIENLDEKYVDLRTFDQHVQRLVRAASQDEVPGLANRPGVEGSAGGQRDFYRASHRCGPWR